MREERCGTADYAVGMGDTMWPGGIMLDRRTLIQEVGVKRGTNHG
jgi:hypothetical protein